jgi:hypothetical protein
LLTSAVETYALVKGFDMDKNPVVQENLGYAIDIFKSRLASVMERISSQSRQRVFDKYSEKNVNIESLIDVAFQTQ